MATALTTGDIAFTAFQSDNSGGAGGDYFQFVLLRDVTAGTTIYFTDNGFLTDTQRFRTNENLLRWVAQADLAAGSLVSFTSTNGSGVANTAEWTGIAPTTGMPGTSTTAAAIGLATTGDQITALFNPTFGGTDMLAGTAIAGIQFGSAVYAATFTNTGGNSDTGLPTGLTDGVNAVSVGNFDNGRYAGPVLSGTVDQIRAALNNDANWTTSEDVLTPFAGPSLTVTTAATTGNFTIAATSGVVGADGVRTIAEGNGGTEVPTLVSYTITRTGGSGAATVGYSIGGGVTLADYVGDQARTVEFNASDTEKVVTVAIVGDTVAEQDEALTLTLTGATGGTFSTTGATTLIANDDGAAPPTLSIGDPTVVEGNGATTTLRYVITASATSTGDITVLASTADGTATTADNDYVARSNVTVTIAAGQTQAFFDVTVNGDTRAEPNETVIVNLTGAANATIADAQGVGTIANDDVAITRIHDIQGSSYFSPLLAAGGVNGFNIASTATVTIQAVVTAVDGVGARQGFYVTEARQNWDSSDLTSEGIFVMTRNDASAGTVLASSLAAGVAVGDIVTVTASIMEYQSFQTLPRTVLTGITSFAKVGATTDIPTLVLDASRPIPNEILTGVTPNYFDTVDDAGDTFDASRYALSFFETVEGMLVTLPNVVVADGFYGTSTSSAAFFQAYSLTHANPDQINSRGGYTIAGDPPVGPAVLDTPGSGDDTTNGGRVLHDGDTNPDVVELDFTDFAAPALPADLLSRISMGDRLGDVTGIIDFDFTDRKLFVTQAPTLVDTTQTVETTALVATANQLTVATFNVENLDPTDGAARFQAIAGVIVANLKLPDILSIEEIQDSNGAATGAVTVNGVTYGQADATLTWQMLVAAINEAARASGSTAVYQWVDQEPVYNAEGGEQSGNIRVGFLYNTTRVQLGDLAADATIEQRRQFTDRIGDGIRDAGDRIAFSDDLIAGQINTADWANTRKSLLGQFTFNGETVYAIANHLPAKGGSGQFYQVNQTLETGNPENAAWAKRNEVAQDLWAMMDIISTGTPNAKIVAGGDFNDFYFYRPLLAATGYVTADGAARLGGARFDNLTLTLPEAERYTYTFDGRSQAIDHVIASRTLSANAEYDIVHLNTGFNKLSTTPLSDHDPAVARFTIAPPADTTAPTLVSSSPADNAVNVATGGNVVLTFSEAVKAGVGTISLVPATGATVGIAVTDATQVTFSGNAVTINPAADLRPGVAYDVVIGGGVIVDTAGNAFAGIALDALDFTTGPAAAIPPGSFATSFVAADAGTYTLAAGTSRTQTANVGVSVIAANVAIDIQGTLTGAASTRAINFASGSSGSLMVGNDGVVQATNQDAFRSQATTTRVDLTNLGRILSTTAPFTPTAGGTNPGTGFAVQYNAATGAANAAATDVVSGGVITNGSASVSSALIRSDAGDAIRLGSHQTLINYGTINGNGPVNDGSANNAFNATGNTSTAETYDSSRGVRINQTAATAVRIENYNTITGAQHGIDVGAAGANGIAVVNAAGATITGRNGSGVGADTTAAGAATVTVDNAGTIRGGYAPGYDRAGYVTIDGDGDGVDIDGGATIINRAGALIEGTGKGGFDSGGRANNAEGISIGGGIIDNAGTIRGTDRGIVVNNDAVASRSGVAATTITNAATGTITGDAGFAIRLENKTGTAADDDTIINFGTITGNGTIPGTADPVRLQNGAIDANSVGTLDGVVYTGTGAARFVRGDGAAIQTGEGADMIGNYGTIRGNTGRAINLEGGDDTLILYTGGSVIGRIDGGVGADTLRLRVDDRTTGNGGAIGGSFTDIVNTETLAVDSGRWTMTALQSFTTAVDVAAGATLVLADGADIGSSGLLTVDGTLSVMPSGTLALLTRVAGTGTLSQDGGGLLALSAANSSFSGTIALNAGTLQLGRTNAAGTATIAFADGAQTLSLSDAALGEDVDRTLGNRLSGFGAGDGIELRDRAAAGLTVGFDALTGRLSVFDSRTESTVASLLLSGSYAGRTFSVRDNGQGIARVTVGATPTPPTPFPLPTPTPTPTPSPTPTPAPSTIGGGDPATVTMSTDGRTSVAAQGSFVLAPDAAVAVLAAATPTGTDSINLTGNGFAQAITGNFGNNVINGGGGGGDTLAGLLGNDTYLVSGPTDVVLENNGEGADLVYTTGSYNLGVNEVEALSTVTHIDTTPIDLIGNFATQTIVGNYGANVLNGGSGGLDTLIGLFGDDVYAIGDSRVVVVEQNGQGFDTLVASVDYRLSGGVSIEVLAAQDRSSTTGLRLTGNDIGQTVAGTEGADTLNGGGGTDVLLGGGGADRFDFTAATSAGNVAALADFQAGTDRVGLSSGVFAVGTGLDAAEFIVGSAATTAEQRIVYNQATGQLFYDADGNGGGAAVLFALVTPGTALSVTSFDVIPPLAAAA